TAGRTRRPRSPACRVRSRRGWRAREVAAARRLVRRSPSPSFGFFLNHGHGHTHQPVELLRAGAREQPFRPRALALAEREGAWAEGLLPRASAEELDRLVGVAMAVIQEEAKGR